MLMVSQPAFDASSPLYLDLVAQVTAANAATSAATAAAAAATAAATVATDNATAATNAALDASALATAASTSSGLALTAAAEAFARSEEALAAVHSAGGDAMTRDNKNMPANETTADYQPMTAIPIAHTPALDSFVRAFVNGVAVGVGDGVRTYDCYFSRDGGDTALAIADIAALDVAYWVASVAGYHLQSTDVVDFDYST